MNARDTEEALLEKCARLARGEQPDALDQREANVVRLAAMVTMTAFPKESSTLRNMSEDFFQKHPSELLEAGEVVRQGWIVSLPRLRDMMTRLLSQRVIARTPK